MADNKRKRLLNEDMTLKLMSIAGISKYAKNFLNESQEIEEEQELEEKQELEQEVMTKGQARVSGDTDRLKENTDKLEEDGLPPPPPPPAGGEPGEGGEGGEPDGDEVDVQALVAALADAIQQTTGVPVSVEGGGAPEGVPGEEVGELPPPGGGEGEEPPMTEAEQKLAELGYVKENGAYVLKNEGLKEDAHQEKVRGEPKPGSQEKTSGVPTPEKPYGSKNPAEGKPKDGKSELVEAVVKRVLTRLMKEAKKQKEQKK